MIFLHLFSLLIREKCIASTKMPPQPPSSFSRILTFVLTRHGSRTPIYIFNKVNNNKKWRCDFDSITNNGFKRVIDDRLVDYPLNCAAGDLTNEGISQHFSLGQKVREYLGNNVDINGFSEEEFLVRTTSINRAYRSAVSFIQGLTPPVFPNEKYKAITGSESFDILRPNVRHCSELKKLRDEYTKSEYFINELSESYEKMKNAYEILGINLSSSDFNRINLKETEKIEFLSSKRSSVCDFIVTNDCFENDIFDGETVDYCENLFGTISNHFYHYDNEKARFISFSQGFREMFRIIDQRIATKSNLKFALFSAHDSSVTAMLHALGQNVTANPPYASHVITDVLKKGSEYFVRFSYNGNIIKIPYLDSYEENIYSFDSFRATINSLIDHCHDFDQ
ncbi:histidine acid phosphatase [Tritrichomonas foetus]|uniref:Histidine acid phosphatase n=1 Tax=Tritrichomonas foetus TaxID=1144522 RepID=A0A1J4JDN2_9EUKA|nr:histidine acid phosphatase [Tritrichomonas foetus]|eukprot:OHS95364.1 histidine acid phosphatase [Tritrichomonas foetus]